MPTATKTISGNSGKASAPGAARSGLRSLAPSQSWQLPLLLFSLCLFGYAGYLFVDPKAGPTIAERIEGAQALIRQERGEAAIEVLNKLLPEKKLDKPRQGVVHLLLAEALEVGQREKKVDLLSNHEQIITQTKIAETCETPLSAADHRRLGASYERLSKPTDAIASYRHAMALDADRELALHKKVIELLIDDNQAAAASEELEKYLAIVDVADAERSWALGLKAQILIDEEKFTEARALLGKAQKLAALTDQSNQGELAYRLGYAAMKTGDDAEAERNFLQARQLLGVSNPLDADAAFALGKLALGARQYDQANAYLQAVIVSHPDSKVMPLARLQRALVRVARGDDEAALEDFTAIVKQIDAKPSLARVKEPALEALRDAETLMGDRGNLNGAIEVLSHEQTLEPAPPPPFFQRLAKVLEARAGQLAEEAEGLKDADKLRKQDQYRQTLGRAGSAWVAFSRKQTLKDDQGYAEALWRGIDCYDRAGDTPASISALELFVAERPDDSLAPDALLRLGRTYQALGLFDKAIAAFQRNQFRYPNSLAASKSSVPLAQAFIAKGPENYSKAESTLIGVVDNNPLLTPESTEFRQAVLELGQLYYRTARFEEAVARLEEFSNRYPEDPRRSQLRFLMADSYRKSAGSLGERLAAIDAGKLDPTANGGKLVDRVEMVVARRDRLRKSKALYDEVVALGGDKMPSADIEQLYLKLAHFYRADCLFDLQEYDDAIKLYDLAARRYQTDPGALAAYVQIVNAYVALGKPTEAGAANERAKWMLKRIPPEAFASERAFNISRQYWEQWLTFAGESGLWAKQVASGQ
jgi:tetratricopeptide (TPR) repeat protein